MRYQLVAAALFIFCIFCLATGCGGGGYIEPALPDSNGTIIVPAYMPYVEDVVIPDPIYADEDFTLTMRVSSVLEPKLLNGNVQHKLYIAGPGFNPGRPEVVTFPMWMRDVLPSGTQQNTVEFDYPRTCRLPAGEWSIAVQTAKTRELGGVFVHYAPLEALGDWDEHYVDAQTGRTNFVEYRLYPITVVERPGA